MKTKAAYSLRKVLDLYLVMGKGKEAYTPRSIMSMNESGAFLWHMLEQGAEPAELAGSLAQEYGISIETARQDVEKFLAQLREKALVTE